MIIIALVGLALAGAPVLSGTGGYDLPTRQPWAGVELAVHPTNTRGVAPVARLAPGWGFGDGQPIGLVELGAMVRIPEEEAVVRLGVVARSMFVAGGYRTPIQFGDPGLGIVPAAMAALEFEYREAAPLTVGVRAGAGSTRADFACDDQFPDYTRCVTWHTGFVGGFVARKRWKNGLAAEIIVGSISSLSVGRAF